MWYLEQRKAVREFALESQCDVKRKHSSKTWCEDRRAKAQSGLVALKVPRQNYTNNINHLVWLN